MFLQEQNISERTAQNYTFPLLDLRSVSHITQLMPFFTILSCAFKTESNRSLNTNSSKYLKMDCPIGGSTKTLQLLEECVERDFIENMES